VQIGEISVKDENHVGQHWSNEETENQPCKSRQPTQKDPENDKNDGPLKNLSRIKRFNFQLLKR